MSLAENKTKPADVDPVEYISQVEPVRRREHGMILLMFIPGPLVSSR